MYLTEQEKTAKMKIDEPKTPWAPTYDTLQDDDIDMEAEGRTLDAHDLVVDEFDQVHSTNDAHHHDHQKKRPSTAAVQSSANHVQYSVPRPHKQHHRVSLTLSLNFWRSSLHVFVNGCGSTENQVLASHFTGFSSWLVTWCSSSFYRQL